MNFMSAIILSISAKVSAIIGILTKCLIIGYTAAVALYFKNGGLMEIVGKIDGIRVGLGLDKIVQVIRSLFGLKIGV